MIDCLTCEEGYEIVPVHDDCTGFCVKSGASVDYFKSLGFGDLATSTCTAYLDCYEDEERTAIESLPTDGTNDFLPGEGAGSYSYSYSYDVSLACAEEVGFIDCIGAAVLSGEVTQDETTTRTARSASRRRLRRRRWPSRPRSRRPADARSPPSHSHRA